MASGSDSGRLLLTGRRDASTGLASSSHGWRSVKGSVLPSNACLPICST